MRALFSIIALSLPGISEESLVTIAALVLLVLSIATVIWPKFTGLVKMIWADFRAAVREMRDFWQELRQNRGVP